jgi:ParB-like chromosome segregation protein Spo0J
MTKEKAQQPYRMTPITAIRPYERNPRIIPQAAVDAVARSIQAFGFRSPIIVDKNGVILAGHTRYKAAQQLGLAEVPVVWQTDITDIQARGYRIADNKVAELSAWDRDALDLEVRELADLGDTDLDALGLADWELERILADDGGIATVGLPEETPPASYSQARPAVLDAVQTAQMHADDSAAPSREVLLRVVFPDREKLDAASPEVAEVAAKFGGSVLGD